MKIVFVEAWINPIYVRFANEFARQHPTWKVYYLTDSDAIKPGALDAVSDRVTLIGLRNIKAVRRIAYAPLYLGSFISERLEAQYADTLYLHTFAGLSEKLDEIKPDIVQSNVFVMPYTAQAAAWARRNRVPFILRTEERAPRTALQRIGLNALLIANKRVVSEAAMILPWTVQGVDFARKQLQVPPSKIALLPAGVDTAMFSPGKRSPSKVLRLLTVQRFVPYKDYPTLLRGVAGAVKGGLRCTLSILGFGPEEARVRALVDELGLGTIVTFLPSIPYKDMPALYRRHDVLIHTGHHEAIGMVVPESMACGMIPVVCDTAGAITYVTPETGYVFRTGDAADLAGTLRGLKPAAVAKRGAAAAKHIKTKFSVSSTVHEYDQLVSSISNRKL